MQIHLMRASPAESPAILEVIKAAFSGDNGREIAALAENLMADPSAEPVISLVAKLESTVVGQVLFTRARVEDHSNDVSASILAPLSVHPACHGRGIGSLLVERGLTESRDAGQDLVFVLGHPDFYQRFGFVPAGVRGFEAPFPIPVQHADAWMIQQLRPDIIGRAKGRVICADSLNDPRHWRE